MSIHFRPRVGPSGYYYISGYLFVAMAPVMTAYGIVRLDWRPLVLGFASLLVAILAYGFLGWWRERFAELNPDELDNETSRLDRAVDSFSLRTIRAVGKTLSRRRNSA